MLLSSLPSTLVLVRGGSGSASTPFHPDDDSAETGLYLLTSEIETTLSELAE